MTPILQGIISGLLTAILIYGLREYFNRVLIPDYRARIYKGLKVEGDWDVNQQGKTAEGDELTIKRTTKVRIKQKGHLLSGTARSTALNPGYIQESYEYVINGEIKDSFVTLTFKSKNPNGKILETSVIDTYIHDQERSLKLLDLARSKNLSKIKVPTDLGSWAKVKLGDAFRIIVYHNQRHLEQAERSFNAYVEQIRSASATS